jgi:hypothetical protein
MQHEYCEIQVCVIHPNTVKRTSKYMYEIRWIRCNTLYARSDTHPVPGAACITISAMKIHQIQHRYFEYASNTLDTA